MPETKRRRYTVQEKESTLIRSALAVLLERMGGEMTYTQTEFAAVKAAHGDYVISGEVDRSGAGEPLIRVKLEADSHAGSMPTN